MVCLVGGSRPRPATRRTSASKHGLLAGLSDRARGLSVDDRVVESRFVDTGFDAPDPPGGGGAAEPGDRVAIGLSLELCRATNVTEALPLLEVVTARSAGRT